jgi:hypothetical protein
MTLARAGRSFPAQTDSALAVARRRLSELIEAQRCAAAELRRRAGEDDRAIETAVAALTRAMLVLQAGLGQLAAPSEAYREGTVCWLCSQLIVPNRVAEPRDVWKHMSVCSGWKTDRRGGSGKPERQARSRWR